MREMESQKFKNQRKAMVYLFNIRCPAKGHLFNENNTQEMIYFGSDLKSGVVGGKIR